MRASQPPPTSDPGGLPRSRRRRPGASAREDAAYRALFDLAADALFVHDPETGAILDANQAACDLHGCTLDELKALGVGGISAGGPRYDAVHAAAFVRHAAAGEPQRFEWMVRRASGDRVWVEVRLQRVEVLGQDRVLASVRPIEEQKRVEDTQQEARADLERRVEERTAELAEAEQRFRAIVEASPTPLLLSHATDGVVLYANDRLETLIGVPTGSLEGRRTPDFYYDPADRAGVLQRVQEQGYVRDHELRIRHDDGSPRWVSLSTQRLVFHGTPALATALVDITERKEAEAAFRQQTEELEAIFRALPDLYFRMEADGTILAYRAGQQFGLYVPPEAFLGERVQDVLPPPVGAQIDGALADVRRTGRAVGIEYTLPLGDEPRHFEARLLPLAADQVIAVVRDVTERTRAEETIRASEASYRGLFDSLTDLVYVQDLEGRFLAVNEAVVQAYGYSREEMLGQTPLALSPPDAVDPEAFAAFFERVLAGETLRTDWLAQRKDGSTFYKEVVLQRSTYFGADVVLAVGRDVTARVEAERALRFQTTLLEAQGEASIDGILVVSVEGAVLSHNRQFAEMWRIADAVLATGSDAALLASVADQVADADAFHARVAYLYAHPDETARDEIALRDGRTFDRYSAPVRSREGDLYGRIWFFRDMTAQKRHAAEAETARHEAEAARERADRYAASLETSLVDLHQAQDRLVQQEKLAGLGRMTAGIAHEIKNPLNFVTNFAELSIGLADELRAELAADPDRPTAEILGAAATLLDDLTSNARKIAEHGRRADAIVRGMMEHTRTKTGERREIDVNDFVEENVGLAVDGWRTKRSDLVIDVAVDLDPGAGVIQGVPQELARVLINLVSNALDAVADRAQWPPRGGEYVPRVRIATRRRGDAVEIDVRDNGTGVAETARRRLFEPFFTTKPPGEGNVGLGLSLSRDVVVDGHGGSLDVVSGEGEGSTFTVALPAVS